MRVNYRASIRMKRNRAEGKLGEDLVRRNLERVGYKMIERVHTPFTLIRRGKSIVGAFPTEKVSGDFIAIQPMTGRKVLVEVKSRESGIFPWSILEDHQVRALSENHICGGISLLALVSNTRVKIHSWPVDGFGKGKSLKIED